MQADSELYRFSVRWEPFLLRPGMPPDGVQKPPRGGQSLSGDRLVQAGKRVGIDFTYKCDRYPYTLPAHVLIDYAGKKDNGDKQNELVEVIFKAYFTDGLYPDVETLCTLAEQVGFNKEEVKGALSDETNIQRAAASAKSWSKQGVTGVPYFIINGKEVFSGAQEPDAFQHVFKVIAEQFPVNQNSNKSV